MPPVLRKIYHITHADNLPSIIARGGLMSDAAIAAQGGPVTSIGMSSIKLARLTMPVACHPNDCVGDYVPFNFCARSVMFGIIYYANHPALTYRGGQEPIVHLEADLREVVAWADSTGRRWAFTLSNARATYAEFRASLDQLEELDWEAISARDWRSPEVKERKQAEFLLYGWFPWTLVARIGVRVRSVKQQVETALAAAGHRPPVEIRLDWYY